MHFQYEGILVMPDAKNKLLTLRLSSHFGHVFFNLWLMFKIQGNKFFEICLRQPLFLI